MVAHPGCLMYVDITVLCFETRRTSVGWSITAICVSAPNVVLIDIMQMVIAQCKFYTCMFNVCGLYFRQGCQTVYLVWMGTAAGGKVQGG